MFAKKAETLRHLRKNLQRNATFVRDGSHARDTGLLLEA